MRLKSIPGLDMATNAVAVGAFALVAGWVAVRPPAGFPPVMIVEGLLVTTALYVPPTLADVHGAWNRPDTAQIAVATDQAAFFDDLLDSIAGFARGRD